MIDYGNWMLDKPIVINFNNVVYCNNLPETSSVALIAKESDAFLRFTRQDIAVGRI